MAKPFKTLLVISQTFVPDPASVGQHMTDSEDRDGEAEGIGFWCTASEQGYENPAVRYPKREMLEGVEIRRLGFASFGKKNIFPLRVLGTASFMLQAILGIA